MQVKRITHDVIAPIEYYYVWFQTQQDINAFCNTCQWFDKEDAHIGDKYVIKHNDDPDNSWYEILPSGYVRRKLEQELNVKSAILTELQLFFQ